jgi:hypothetical protein
MPGSVFCCIDRLGKLTREKYIDGVTISGFPGTGTMLQYSMSTLEASCTPIQDIEKEM